jgi:hypothetical protein
MNCAGMADNTSSTVAAEWMRRSLDCRRTSTGDIASTPLSAIAPLRAAAMGESARKKVEEEGAAFGDMLTLGQELREG